MYFLVLVSVRFLGERFTICGTALCSPLLTSRDETNLEISNGCERHATATTVKRLTGRHTYASWPIIIAKCISNGMLSLHSSTVEFQLSIHKAKVVDLCHFLSQCMQLSIHTLPPILYSKQETGLGTLTTVLEMPWKNTDKCQKLNSGKL